MGRINERENLYAGRCAYCAEPVQERKGFVFNDPSRGWTNKVRHAQCNEATEQLRKETQAKSAWGSAVTGSEPPKRRYTLDEAVDAVLPHVEGLDEAEELDRMLGEVLESAVQRIGDEAAGYWMARVVPMVNERVEELLASHRPVSISVGDMPAVEMGSVHAALEDVLLMCVAGASPFLVGPAGSGKTTLGSQIAQAMGLKFYMAARVTSEYRMIGFIDANGNCVRTQFREAFEHGGVFLFDEVDASDPDAMTAFNAALANGWCDFPDGMVTKHKDFYAIAAGNTYGRGADRQYVGRNQLDAATLDRFQMIDIDYDEALELRLAGCDPWTKYVQAVRKAVEKAKVRHVVSPRASIMGARLIAAGMDLKKVINATIWKGLDADSIARVINASSEVPPVYQALLRYVSRLEEPEEVEADEMTDDELLAELQSDGDEYDDEGAPF